MFLPLHDNTPLSVIRFQYATGAIILINVAIFLYTHYVVPDAREIAIATSFGAIPAVFTNHAHLSAAHWP